MTLRHNGQEVEITDIEGEVSEGAYAVEGHYVDTGIELDDADLEAITERYSERLYDEWYQGQVMGAEARYEGER